MDVQRIDFDGAELFIHAEGDWRGFRSAACAKEPETASWITQVARPGSIFFDVGACVGSYSFIAAALGATVHAFEPVAVNYAQLQRNAWLNSSFPITAWPVALASETRLVEFALSSATPGAASHSIDATHAELTQAALGFSLDHFIELFQLPQPTDIKVDVDGGEVEVLEGARSTLRGVSSVMVEVSPDTAPSVAAILQAAGLELAGTWHRSGRQSNHLFKRRVAMPSL